MSERSRLAVLARHLAPSSDEHATSTTTMVAAPSPTSMSSFSSSSSAAQLSAFCPRELSRYMTHDNHELRENIREFLKVRDDGFVEGRGRKNKGLSLPLFLARPH